jgi:hypothetical protein
MKTIINKKDFYLNLSRNEMNSKEVKNDSKGEELKRREVKKSEENKKFCVKDDELRRVYIKAPQNKHILDIKDNNKSLNKS